MIRFIIALTFILFKSVSFAYELDIDCGEGLSCKEFKNTVLPDLVNISGHNEVWAKLKDLAKEDSIERFSLEASKEDQVIYKVKLKLKRKVSEVNINFTEDDSELADQIIQKTDTFLNKSSVEIGRNRILENLRQRGYLKPSVSYDISIDEDDKIILTYNVQVKGQKKVEKVTLIRGNENLDFETNNKLKKLEGKSYDRLKIIQVIENIERGLLTSGFYNSKIKHSESLVSTEGVEIKVDIETGKKTNFSIRGNKTIETREVLDLLRQEITAGNVTLTNEDLKAFFEKLYEQRSLYGSIVTIDKRSGFYRDQIPIENIYIKIIEGKKRKISKLLFKGNQQIRISELEDLFYENAPVAVERGFYEKAYVEKFTSVLKSYYLENGFLLSDIKSNISFSKEGAEVFYTILEGQRCTVRRIVINGTNKAVADSTRKVLKNQGGKPFNVLALEEDIKNAISHIKGKGYYFATLRNYEPEKILSYFANYSLVDIELDFKTGKILVYNDLNIEGLKKTKVKTVRRENIFNYGEIITPVKLEKLNEKVGALGIFSNVSIKPEVLNKFSGGDVFKTNINLFLKEKNPGTGIIAPGYRTDLGAKLSFSLLYRNLYGLNHTVALKTQFNRRFTLGDLDARRKADKHHFIETLLNLNYSWPYFLDYFDFDVSSSFQRRRVFSFDADILRLSPRLSKQFNDYFSSSLRYQLEDIRQTDASNEKDDARFRVGSITPSLTLDFRDSPVAPREGSYFNLSWEFGNPYFGSQKAKNFEINYSKIVSRNRFYYPIHNKIFVLALSVSMGYQVNYADELRLNSDGTKILNSDNTFQTKGYIPSIKVFRLDGQDNVRGFSNSEINRLSNGEAISDVRVQNTAYFANLKFEPRYYLSDSIGLGLFFDAGRVYVNHFQPLSLRTSVGGSFKFLTPVGSLDFDYGVKVERNRLNDGGREGFGRFHLSIGLF